MVAGGALKLKDEDVSSGGAGVAPPRVALR